MVLTIPQHVSFVLVFSFRFPFVSAQRPFVVDRPHASTPPYTIYVPISFKMKIAVLVASVLASLVAAIPVTTVRRAGDCKNVLINFDDASLSPSDPSKLGDINSDLSGFKFDGFRIATCPGTGCKSFPAESTKQFTGPHMALAEGLVGGLLVKEVDLATSPKGTFTLADEKGSFDLGNFDVFDIIDLPEQVKLGAREDMRVHLDCAKAGSLSRVQLTIPFNRNKDSAGYSVTQSMLGDQFTALSSCKISTTQVFFPFGKELEIPTESMGLDNFNACVR